MPAPLKIWTNAAFGPEVQSHLEAELGNHQLLIEPSRINNLGAGGKSEVLSGADVAFGHPDPDQALSLPGLKWIQLTSAGYTRFDTPEFRSGYHGRLTNCSSVFDDPCAQHLLAFMLAQARQLPQCLQDQLGERSWSYDKFRLPSRVLRGDQVLILGFGAIARRLVELLTPFNVQIIGARRNVNLTETVPIRPISEIVDLVGTADHIVNILPSNAEADGMVNRAVFQAMKPGAVFYNIGRGSTVDQEALIEVLETGQLRAAYLDVTTPEPLPKDHPLWSAPNCFITPHTGGGMQDEELAIVDHFLGNLRRYEAGEPLVNQIL